MKRVAMAIVAMLAAMPAAATATTDTRFYQYKCETLKGKTANYGVSKDITWRDNTFGTDNKLDPVDLSGNTPAVFIELKGSEPLLWMVSIPGVNGDRQFQYPSTAHTTKNIVTGMIQGYTYAFDHTNGVLTVTAFINTAPHTFLLGAFIAKCKTF